jgi:hypothetical protein
VDELSSDVAMHQCGEDPEFSETCLASWQGCRGEFRPPMMTGGALLVVTVAGVAVSRLAGSCRAGLPGLVPPLTGSTLPRARGPSLVEVLPAPFNWLNWRSALSAPPERTIWPHWSLPAQQ